MQAQAGSRFTEHTDVIVMMSTVHAYQTYQPRSSYLLQPFLQLTERTSCDQVNINFREHRSKHCQSTSARVTQHLSRAYFYVTSLVATGIMRNPHFLYGVVLLGMMTTCISTAIMVTSVASIQQEGNAIADIARAIPGLTIGTDRFLVHIVCMTCSS